MVRAAARRQPPTRTAGPRSGAAVNDRNDTPRGVADLAEAEAFLAANPDIEAVQLVITDANGVGRGKNVAREGLATLFGAGRKVAGTILGLDVTGEDVEGTGLV